MAPPPSSSHERRLVWYVGAGLFAFVAAALGPSLVGRNTLLSVNMLTNYFPWLVSGSQTIGHQLCSGDTIDSGIPGIHYVREQLASGHLPNWQNIVAGGSSLGSQPNLGLLNPLSLPYFLLPLWLAPAFVKLLQLIVAVGGTYLFLRRLALGRVAGLLAGFTFAVSGFMVMWTNWPQTVVAACIPALFWATERLMQRARATDAVLIAVVVASMLLGGFPAVTGWALYAAAGYLIVRVVTTYRHDRAPALRRIVIGAGGIALGLVVSMIQLLPFALQYHATDLSYRSGQSVQPLPVAGLITLVAPSSNGLCVGGTTSYGAWNSVELISYIGSAALVLAIVGMAVRRRRGALAVRGVRSYLIVTVAAVLLLGWGGGYALHLVSHVPVFSGNLIGRIRSLLGFLLAVLVGFGFDALMQVPSADEPADPAELAEPDEPKVALRRFPSRTLLVVSACVLIGMGVVIDALRVAHDGGHLGLLAHRLVWPALLIALAVVAVAFVYSRRPGLRTFALYLLPALIIAQGFQFFHAVLPGDSRRNFYPVTATHSFLAANLGSDRYVATNGELYPATSLYYDLRSVTGHAFHEGNWQLLLQELDPEVMQSATFSQLTGQDTTAQLAGSTVLNRMAAKYLVVDPGTLTGSFGTVSHGADNVDVTAQNAASCVLPAGKLRGVSFWVTDTWLASNAQKGETINVTATAGATTVASGRFVGTGVPSGIQLSVAVAGEDFPANTPVHITVTATGGSTPLVLAGRPGALNCAAVRPADDDLKVVFADAGSIIYQRLEAMPRIRWASGSVVVDKLFVVAEVQQGLPVDDVLLETPGPAADGKPATVHVDRDASDQIVTTVDAEGAGYLVVADALQDPGWTATIDGKRTAVLPADAAMGAVAVPAGVHRIVFSYRAPGQAAGAALTALGIALMIGLGIGQRYHWLGGRARVEAQRDSS